MELVVRYKEAEHWLWSETFLPLSNEPWATHSLHHYSGHSLPCAWEVWEEFQWFLPFKMMILNAVVFFMQCVCAQVAQCHPCWHRVPRPVQGSSRQQCERRMYFSCSRDCIQMKTLFFLYYFYHMNSESAIVPFLDLLISAIFVTVRDLRTSQSNVLSYPYNVVF